MESLQNWGLMGENCINSGFYWGSEAGNYYVNLGREGPRRAVAGLRFAEEWAAEEILDQVGSRLAAGRGLLQRHKLHACPAGGYSSMKKSRQKIFRPSW